MKINMAEIKKKKIKKIKSKKILKKKVVKKVVKKTIKKLGKKLERFIGNPIIHPARGTYWESKATFNPTAFEHDGKVHIIYRAIGVGDISTLGYASSNDGLSFGDRNFKPIFVHKNISLTKGEPVFYESGGGWNGGAEDPRITKIDDMLYMTYTAFDGWGSVRIGLTSISLEDFLNKKWNWREPVMISPPGMPAKNGCLLPEKINGKYVIFSRLHLGPNVPQNITIDFVDDLSFKGKWLKGEYQINPREGYWDSIKVGVGAPPIKTKYGWLFIYQGVGYQDPSKYKIGAMLLDLKDPTKVLYRSKEPILEPDMFYENEGYKSGVVYSCGAVIKDGTLFVYYGGADMVTCVATADLNLFLKELKETGIVKLKKGKK